MSTEARVYSQLFVVEFKLASPPYRRFEPTEDKDGMKVWTTPDLETRQLRLVTRDKPSQWVDILVKDFPDRSVAQVGKRVTQRIGKRETFPTLSKLISTHPVGEAEVWIRLRDGMVNLRRVPPQDVR